MSEMRRLLEIMARLRDPEGGCPWDRQQTFASILPYTLEEAYEVAEAIDSGDMAALRAELGDLLFQVVFYAQLAKEAGEFAFGDIVASICDKLERRHPHVFGDAPLGSSEEHRLAWEAMKQQERAAKASAQQRPESVLDDVPQALPGLVRAVKLQRRAARVGFDWAAVDDVLAKIEEELAEVRHELANGSDHGRLTHEVGDVLFACSNLARCTGVDAEVAMRGVNERFERRFRRIEALLALEGRTPSQATLEEMDRLWEQAKAEEVEPLNDERKA